MTNRRSSTRRIAVRSLAGVLVVALAAALFAPRPSSASGNEPAPLPPSSTRALPVETVRVQYANGFALERSYSGEITARRSSNLGFERGGRLVEVLVEEGARVEAGQRLARLDTELLEASLTELDSSVAGGEAALAEMLAGPRAQTIEAARADVRQLEVLRELWKKKRARREDLLEQGHISEEEVEEAASEVAVLEARIAGAQETLAELEAGTRAERVAGQRAELAGLAAKRATLQLEIEKSSLRAPFAGTVTRRLADEGEMLSPALSVLRLVEDGRLEARVGLPLAASRRLAPGDVVELSAGIGRDARRLGARVAAVLPEVDAGTRTLTLLLTLDPGSHAIPGELVRLGLPEEVQSRGAWLPASALARGARGLWSVYTVVGGADAASVERRDVEVLHTEGERVFVRGTLSEGDQVVLGSAHRIVPGQRVRIATDLAQ